MPQVSALIEARGVGVKIGRHELLSHVDLGLQAGEIVSLIGPNGAGKTTLLRVLLGVLEPTSGGVVRRPGLTVGYVPPRPPSRAPSSGLRAGSATARPARCPLRESPRAAADCRR
jgi:ABC-type Mn2+/Zn2+ transport system ATPase subunit